MSPGDRVARREGKVAVVVVNVDRPADTLECVDSVRASRDAEFAILVVDNGSTPDRRAELAGGLAERTGVVLIPLDPNRGFAGGVNAGLERALATDAEYVWILACDTVVEPDAMRHLVATFRERPGAGVAGAMTYYAGTASRIWYAGGFVERGGMGMSRHRGQGEHDTGQYGEVVAADFANGSSVFARLAVAKRIGGLDGSYFLYWEDADWCARATEAGWSVLFVPQARVWHKVTERDDERLPAARAYDARNRLVWHARHRRSRLGFVLAHVLKAALLSALRGHPEDARIHWSGVAAFLSGRLGRIREH